jgi:hypothetical protein
VASVLAFREISLSDNALSVWFSTGVLVAAVALPAFLVYRQWRSKRQVEDKVRMSNQILLSDIQILAKSNSELLEDAIALRRAQLGLGHGPGE